MQQAAIHLKGTHDFTSFCTVHSDAPDRIRSILAINVTAIFPGLIHVQVEADGFLRYMVRNIVGTLAEIGLGKYEPDFIKDILKAKDRAAAGPTAPAKGLFLKEVRY
jgi:tRNA pseudouridine38-40 synthase